jgi:PIN domain nuclease of toxin-antitoxin system
MRLLLDTHALLWWLLESPKLPESWRLALASPENDVYVSAASIWEIAIKRSLGKLQLPAQEDIASLPERCHFDSLSCTAIHAARTEALPWHHRDPFDRMLVAQSLCEKLDLVSADPAMRDYEVSLFDGG